MELSFLREKRHHPDGTEAIVITSPKTTIDWQDTAREQKESGGEAYASMPTALPPPLSTIGG
ncbi:hypothetical protein PanWU01x14_081270 [Parasponia andersonii]|uniref:Uncharacterized protein n=1 Tax=Parasponia andersonii TaxID=3476 RepID=A0A2P5DAZ7_PARAD|nr:hypothetical protein PanWU01x14_081270 [Parasponia andersonii]